MDKKIVLYTLSDPTTIEWVDQLEPYGVTEEELEDSLSKRISGPTVGQYLIHIHEYIDRADSGYVLDELKKFIIKEKLAEFTNE